VRGRTARVGCGARVGLWLAGFGTLVAGPILGQTTPPRKPAPGVRPAPPPCCWITKIDGTTGVIEARERSSRYSFEFKVSDRRVVEELRVGQRIWADFTLKKVSLRAGERCCDILPHDPKASPRGTP
jgi:hypothetical protein